MTVPETMHSRQIASRREFLNTTASGLGAAGLGHLLSTDNVLDAGVTRDAAMTPRPSHHAPRAKACIFIFMAGAPSQMDLFDPKPILNERHGESLPKSLLDKARFAFIQPDTATLLGTKRRFRKHGECGMDFSDILPHIGQRADDLLMIRSMTSEEFNHHPGQLLMQCGVSRFGMPTMGSWVTYALGNESQNLPGYVVLTAGRGSSGGATLYQSGFLPTSHAGVLFRDSGDPVLNLATPPGIPPALQANTLDVVNRLNRQRFAEIHDPEINSRIASYELAGRMQTAAPELIDLSSESQHTLDAYGIGRAEPEFKGRGRGRDTYNTFSKNCLLARRLVERGVRFINIIHASWDHHSNLDDEINYNATMADQPIAALIADLKQRGMLDETLVVWGSEFGRTPLGENRGGRNANTGRDHHPFCFSMFLAGGGFKQGLTYGKTDEIGWSVVENPVHVNDFHATLLHAFGLDHLKLTYRFQGRDFRLTDVAGNVITDWLA